jgi:hypothetical protein
VGYVLRAFFFLLAAGGLVVFLYLYRRRTNAILAIVVGSYAFVAGVRLLTVESDADLLWQAAIALAGLGLVWVLIRYGARWVEKAGWLDRD